MANQPVSPLSFLRAPPIEEVMNNSYGELIESLIGTVHSLEVIAKSPHLKACNIQFNPRIASGTDLPELIRFVEESAAYIAGRVRY